MTNFYRRQEQAKLKSIWLTLCFFAAVAGTAFMMSLTGAGIFWLFDSCREFQQKVVYLLPIFSLLILGASLIRTIILLNSGGAGISRKLGGVPLALKRKELSIKERQLNNVVEEMAIASGISMPQIDILEKEYGINAFVVGFTQESAVVGVTRGAVDLLNREQMQGVIAHEFSHIVSGDMRLNLLLVGFLFGLLGPLAFVTPPPPSEDVFLGDLSFKGDIEHQVGGLFAESVAILILAVLCSTSILGCLYSSYIKSYINKQRELLADASAVQFTRNNAGLAGALKMIGGYSRGARLTRCNVLEFNHIFVAESAADITVNSSLISDIINFFETHPPLTTRILQLEPDWDGTFPQVAYSVKVRQEEIERAWIEEGLIAASTVAASLTVKSENLSPALSPLQKIEALAEDKNSAILIPILLLFDGTKTARHFIARDIAKSQFVKLRPLLDEKIAEEKRLPLLLSALPALQQLPAIQKQEYMTLFDMLSLTNKKVTPDQWRLLAILGKALKQQRVVSLQKNSGESREQRLEQAMRILFAEFAKESGGEYALYLFKGVMEKFGFAPLPMPKTGNYLYLEAALNLLNTALSLAKKEAVIEVCSRMIAADKKMTAAEAELYQVVAMWLGGGAGEKQIGFTGNTKEDDFEIMV